MDLIYFDSSAVRNSIVFVTFTSYQWEMRFKDACDGEDVIDDLVILIDCGSNNQLTSISSEFSVRVQSEPSLDREGFEPFHTTSGYRISGTKLELLIFVLIVCI